MICKMEEAAIAHKGPLKKPSLAESAKIQMIRLSKSSKMFQFKGRVRLVSVILLKNNTIWSWS